MPRRRGGLPTPAPTPPSAFWFAPQTRGSTQNRTRENVCRRVCPADAGVYPGLSTIFLRPECLPRRRGGLPSRDCTLPAAGRFAPQTRGSTASRRKTSSPTPVCPADAGVYRIGPVGPIIREGLPRRRGGLPVARWVIPASLVFAPQTRGSTLPAGG